MCIRDRFFRAGYVESWGRGIEKILSECHKHDIPPPLFDTSLSGLMLTFCADPAQLAEALGGAARPVLGETLVEAPVEAQAETPVETPLKTPERILAALGANPEWTLEVVAQAIGKSTSAVERAAAKLVKEGRLRFVGPRKAGHWEVLK